MVNDRQVGERDGIAISGEPGIAITAISPLKSYLWIRLDLQSDLLE
jgi:hypothetical protein